MARSLVLLRHGPINVEPPFTGCSFDALASCLVEGLLEGLRVREVGVLPVRCRAVEDNDYQWNLVVALRVGVTPP